MARVHEHRQSRQAMLQEDAGDCFVEWRASRPDTLIADQFRDITDWCRT